MVNLFRFRQDQAVSLAPTVLVAVYALAGTVGAVSGGVWAVLGLAGALLAGGLVFWGGGHLSAPERQISGLTGMILAVAAMSLFHAVDTPHAAYALFKIATVLLPLLLYACPEVLSVGQAALPRLLRLWPWMIAGLAVLSVLLIQASHRYGPDSGEVTKLNRGLSYLLMMSLPLAAAFLAKRDESLIVRCCFYVFVLVVAGVLALTHSRATQMGITLAVVVFVVASLLPRLTMIGLGALTCLAVAWPWLASWAFLNAHVQVTHLPSSWFHRVEIWDYFFYRILESPLFGHGIACSHLLDWAVPHGPLYAVVVAPASHPHNAFVQLWVELGVWGACMGLALGLFALWRASALSRRLIPFGLAAYGYAFCLLMSAYNFWTDSLWAALALMIFSFAVADRAQRMEDRKLKHS